jgi:23S rRNA (uridine2552-2'-O)-methyltransferase
MVGDVLDPSLPSKILEAFKTKVDVVLSDASPNISGVWEVDHARQIELAQAAFTLAKAVLRKGGVCMVKVFEGPLTKEFQRELKQAFEVVRVFKPQASRARSSELYFLGLGFREDSSQQV